jgi:hypothetical protein
MFTLFKKIFSATLIMSACLPCVGQPPSVQWNKTYGGSYPEEHSVTIQTTDGGYLSAGSSRSSISGLKSQTNWDGSLLTFDFWIVKSDALGNLQWEKRFGGTSQDVCTAMLQTTDNGYVLGGYSSSPMSGDKTSSQIYAMDYWLMKLDASGTKQWEKIYGGNGNDYLTSFVQNSSGGFMLAGFTTSGISGTKTDSCRGGNDYWVVCTDAWGNQLWDRTFGGSDNDYARCVKQTLDGGWIIGGNSQSGISGDKTENNHGASLSSDYWIVKIDENGNKQWDKRFGSMDDDILTSLLQMPDGTYLLGGYSTGGISYDKSVGSRGGYDYWILKATMSGAKIWDRRFGGATTDYLYSMQLTSDGGFLLAGSSDSPLSGDKSEASRGQVDYWIIKTNASGTKQWDKTLGGTDEDWLSSARQTIDGGYILGGRSLSPISGEKSEGSYGNSDFWIIKLGPPSPLPILLVDFSGEQSNERIQLKWTTASEINNSYFTIEKMMEGMFVQIQNLPGSGNTTSMMYYETYDDDPINGDNYYRLTQTDYDGHSETFTPIIVNYKKSAKNILTTYPNPATDFLNVSWKEISDGRNAITITDCNGKTCYKEIVQEGRTQTRIPVSQLTKGFYIVTMESEQEQLKEKFELR